MLSLALPPTPTPARSLWVWHTREIVDSTSEQEKFFDFLKAPRGDASKNISVIFVSREGVENVKEYPKLQAFIKKAHKLSIRVDYLCGDAYYVLPDKQKEGLYQLTLVQQYNQASPKSARFDGIQYDVEPYSLPGWPKKEILDGYVSFLRQAHSMVATSHNPLLLGCAIPRWFDGPDLHGLYKTVIDSVDYVAVMDYVNNARAFVEDGSNEVEYGTKTGKQVWLGAETSELKDEPMATFYAKGDTAMEQAFHAAFDAYSHERGFAGVAIEHYEPYIALKP